MLMILFSSPLLISPLGARVFSFFHLFHLDNFFQWLLDNSTPPLQRIEHLNEKLAWTTKLHQSKVLFISFIFISQYLCISIFISQLSMHFTVFLSIALYLYQFALLSSYFTYSQRNAGSLFSHQTSSLWLEGPYFRTKSNVFYWTNTKFNTNLRNAVPTLRMSNIPPNLTNRAKRCSKPAVGCTLHLAFSHNMLTP